MTDTTHTMSASTLDELADALARLDEGATHLTCTEADACARFLRELRGDALADRFLAFHAAADDDGDDPRHVVIRRAQETFDASASPRSEAPATRHIKAYLLAAGDVMVLPFGRTATITEARLGNKYVNLRLDGLPKTRIGRYDDVAIQAQPG